MNKLPRRDPPMRVMKRDEKEYKRLRRNYRAKLWRIRRKTNFSLPAEEIDKELGLTFPSLPEFREGAFKTRKNFNAFKKRVEEVTDRSFQPLQISENKRGMRYPNLAKQFGHREARKAQQKADEQRERYRDLPLIIDGEQRGTVGDSQLALTDDEAYGIFRPSDFDIDDFVNPESVERRIEKDIERQTDEYFDEKKTQMLENFKSIFDGKGEYAQEIVKMLEQVDPDDFYEMYLMFTDIISFEDWDSGTGEHISGDTNAWYYELEQILSGFMSGDIDTSLKDIG